jgi:hypothetical protein
MRPLLVGLLVVLCLAGTAGCDGGSTEPVKKTGSLFSTDRVPGKGKPSR